MMSLRYSAGIQVGVVKWRGVAEVIFYEGWLEDGEWQGDIITPSSVLYDALGEANPRVTPSGSIKRVWNRMDLSRGFDVLIDWIRRAV